MNVSIVMPIFNPDRKLFEKITNSLKGQKFSGKTELIKVDRGLGLAESMNYGIKKAKYEIVVTLHQDCMPSEKNWLSSLIAPFKDKEVIASVSKVELPFEFWNNFDPIAKVLSVKEQRVITPALDEKGCAYRRSALLKSGLFNSKDFRTAGEDFDMYLKLKEMGKIAYPDAKVIHYHHYSWRKRINKELQLSNGFGALVRLKGRKMPSWYIGIAKSIPLLGYPFYFKGLSLKKLKTLVLLAIPLFLIINLLYFYGFWKGFIVGRETV